MLNTGDFVDRYRISAILGRGSRATVYKAEDGAIGRVVALRVLDPLPLHLRADIVSRVRSAAQLHHTNIELIFDVGEHDGHPFFVTEYVHGETLATLIRRQAATSESTKLQVAEDLCAALHYAHSLGIVHGDIRPANVMIDGNGVVKVLGFGMADVGGVAITTDTLVGTPSYMAPEQLQGKPVDRYVDMFSVGVTLYEMLSYRRPFRGDPIRIFHQILTEGPEPLDKIVPSLDAGLVALVNRCLEKQPGRRYPDMAAVCRDLADVRDRMAASACAATVLFERDPAVVSATPLDEDGAVELRALSTMEETDQIGAVTENAEPQILERTLDLAILPVVPVLTPMELIALLRLPDSPSLGNILAAEGETTLGKAARTRNFGMEFMRDALGRLKPTIVTMRVIAPDFEPPRIEKTVRVRPDRDAERQTFLLTPKALGRLRIQFDILMGEIALASRSLETTADTSDRLPARPQPVLVSVPLTVTTREGRQQQGRFGALARLARTRPVWMASTAVAVVLLAVLAVVFRGAWPVATRPERVTTPPAAIEVRGLGPEDRATTAPARAGRFYALVIGINQYKDFPPLITAVNDANAVAAALRDQYGFDVRLLQNSTRYEILSALNLYRTELDRPDSLVIYYAGHGHYDREADKAYWLPADAQATSSANWIIADDITTDIRVVRARHVLVISDSCYSGGLTREASPSFTPQERDRYLQKMDAGTSRSLLASGGNEPVSDSGTGGHSVFADALLKGLRTIPLPRFTAQELFSDYIAVSVAGRSQQTPQYTYIRNSGHDAGDFVFLRASSR